MPLMPEEYEEVTVEGKTFYVPPNDHIGKLLQQGVYYEKTLLQAVSRVARRGVFVDCGAFVGTHTLFFAENCPSTKVIAIEPQPDIFALLQKTVARSPYAAKIRLVHGAVHNTWQKVNILRSGDNHLGMSQVAQGTEIPAYRLDALLAGMDVSVIKIDVEGGEVSCVQSATETIRRCKPTIVTEAWNNKALLAIQAALPPGYVCSERYNSTPTYIWTRT